MKYKIELVLIGIILLFASYIRLNDIRNYQVFLGDQGRDVLTVKRMIVDRDMTFLGPTASVGGFFLGPFYYYLMVIPLALSGLDPVGPAVMVALFSIATTYMAYSFGRRYFSVETGLIAAALYSISRLVVEYARSSWNPNVLPFFSFLLVYIFAILIENKSRHKKLILFAIGSCLGILIQLHYAVMGMYILSAVAYCIYVWKDSIEQHMLNVTKRIKEMAIMGLGMGLFFGPFLAFEIYHSFPNFTNIVRFIFTNRGGGFSGGYTYEFIIRDTIYRLFLRLVAGGNDILAVVTISITVVGLIIAAYLFISRFYLYGKAKGKEGSFNEDLQSYFYIILSKPMGIGYILMVLWLICGVAPWGFYKKAIYDYYYSYMYVLPIMLLAISLGLLLHLKNKQTKVVGSIASLCLLIALIATNYKSLQQVFPGMQVQRAQWVAEAILKRKTDGPYNFALITPGNSDHAYRYFLEIWGHAPVPLEEQVTNQLIVFCEPDVEPCEPEGNSLWEVAGFGPSSIVGQWEVIGLPLYRLEHGEQSKQMEGKPAKKG
ncbi:MAG: glycosyltransferase family 39 protein [bacterium]|nr:glycosyltransferase family 39 protein [bacterium]